MIKTVNELKVNDVFRFKGETFDTFRVFSIQKGRRKTIINIYNFGMNELDQICFANDSKQANQEVEISKNFDWFAKWENTPHKISLGS